MDSKIGISWKSHLRWFIPLLLIPISIFVLALLALDRLGAFNGDSGTGQTVLIVVLSIGAVVIPIVCLVYFITGAQMVYRSSGAYARKMQKRNELAARKLEQQIVREGGPACDFQARTIEAVRATRWYEALSRGEGIGSVDNHNINLEPGETIHHVFRAKYARFYGMNVTYQTGGVFAMGSPLFVAGALIGSAIGNANARTNAQRTAAQQWREIQYVDVFATDRRFIIPVGGRTLSFYYSAVVAFYPELEAMTLTLDFGDQTEPLQLFSPSVSPAAVLLINHLRGHDGLRAHPALSSIRSNAIAS
ncbi:hypothetical protein [Brevibacterium sp.]|uniref:hypothetical protein n=1 Tax=Brevibacterium sp. TaxID=1701 RepID=UPI0028119DFF|nr:hypothetical protein [Brevibacterium sp.]